MLERGQVVGGGVYNGSTPDLPMESRETPEEVRARLEAKRARSTSPWDRPRPPGRDTRQDARVDVELSQAKYVSPDFEPEPDPVPAPAPAPAPEPTPAVVPAAKPTPASPRKQPGPSQHVDAAAIVQDYLDGASIPDIAKARGNATSTVRRTLLNTPGVTLRDDRVTRSGSQKREYEPAVVELVRRLYVDEGLSRAQVARRAALTGKVVQSIMKRHGIAARPDVVTSGENHNEPGRSTLTEHAESIAAAGLTAPELRAWAIAHDVDVAPTGLPSKRVLAAYLAARDAPAVEEPTPAPTPAHGPSRPLAEHQALARDALTDFTDALADVLDSAFNLLGSDLEHLARRMRSQAAILRDTVVQLDARAAAIDEEDAA